MLGAALAIIGLECAGGQHRRPGVVGGFGISALRLQRRQHRIHIRATAHRGTGDRIFRATIRQHHAKFRQRHGRRVRVLRHHQPSVQTVFTDGFLDHQDAVGVGRMRAQKGIPRIRDLLEKADPDTGAIARQMGNHRAQRIRFQLKRL